jgi:hypothetical protein
VLDVESRGRANQRIQLPVESDNLCCAGRATERFATQFRVEMFNILNHPSFFVPFGNEAIFNTNGSTVSNAGKIDMTSTDSRQIQFGLKIVF